MEYYWLLTQHDGTETEIPPQAVAHVKRKMASNQPINLKTATIPINQIKSFRITERPFSDVHLLEEAAGAFGEQMLNEDGSMVIRWVKKAVPQDKWNKLYSANIAYKKLGEENSMVIVAFKVPVHLINQSITTYCTDDEVNILNRKC